MYAVALLGLMIPGCAVRTTANRTVAAAGGFVPPGAAVEIRTNDDIEIESADDDRTYPGEVARDVLDQEGKVLIPRGSPAQLVVVRGAGGHIEMALRSITVDGHNYLVQTATGGGAARSIRIPANSVLTFRLDRALTISVR